MSGYTYPLQSNADIRARLAAHPLDTNFMEISPQPNRPAPRTWHHFVECDDAMRRVWRLREPMGVSMYAGSQWFVASRAFAGYVAGAAAVNWPKATQTKNRAALEGLKENFATKYAKYGRHTMVADENYFSTVLKNSALCHTHENKNFVHIQFDQWEHDKPTHKADPSRNKCLMPNPNHCGRSPTLTTLGYLPVLDLAGTLFARKFDPKKDPTVRSAPGSYPRRGPPSPPWPPQGPGADTLAPARGAPAASYPLPSALSLPSSTCYPTRFLNSSRRGRAALAPHATASVVA